MHHRRIGWSIDSISHYYTGIHTTVPDEVEQKTVPPLVQDDFADLEAPDLPHLAPPNAEPLSVAKSMDSLLEIAHIHLAMMPLIVFIVTHLFAMIPMGQSRYAAGWSYLCYGCVVLDVACPLVMEQAPWFFAACKLVGFVGLQFSLLLMSLIICVEAVRMRKQGPQRLKTAEPKKD